MDPDNLPYETLVEQGCETLGILTAHYDRLWQIGSADWSLDQNDGRLSFASPILADLIERTAPDED